MKQSFLLRMPAIQLKKLQTKALKTGQSLNMYLNSILMKSLDSSNIGTGGNELVSLILNSSFKDGLQSILLFGSVAKGLEGESSDLDILIVLSEDSTINRSLYTDWDKEIAENIETNLNLGREVSPHFVKMPVRTDDFHGLWLEVAISGIVLWKKNSKIEAVLQKIRQAIAKGNFIRKETHGHPYWRRCAVEGQL